MNLPDLERDKLDTDLRQALELIQDVVRWYSLPEDANSSLAIVIDEIRYTLNTLGLTE